MSPLAVLSRGLSVIRDYWLSRTRDGRVGTGRTAAAPLHLQPPGERGRGAWGVLRGSGSAPSGWILRSGCVIFLFFFFFLLFFFPPFLSLSPPLLSVRVVSLLSFHHRTKPP